MARCATLLVLAALLAASAVPRAQQSALPPTGTNHVIFTEPGSGGDLPIIVGNGDGFVEVDNPEQDPCPDPGDPGCDLGLGNSVFNDPNITRDYYMGSTGPAAALPPPGTVERLYRYIESIAGEHIGMRWTDEGGYGLQFGAPPLDGRIIVHVPFELWALSDTPGDPSDDVRMIPLLNLDLGLDGVAGGGDDDSTLVVDWTVGNPFVGFSEDGAALPATNVIYMMMPDRANGYDLFEAAALAAGGAGSAYTEADSDTTAIDPANLDVGDISVATGNPCVHQGGFMSWCYRNDRFSGTSAAPNVYGSYFGIGDPDPAIDPNALFVYPIGRVEVVSLGTGVAVEPDPSVPEGFALLPATPNPFDAQTRVAFTAPVAGQVRVTVYDALGRQVAVLADGLVGAGRHEVAFSGAGLAPGLYIARLTVDGKTAATQKLMLSR